MFVRSFLFYIPVMMCVGIVGHIESMAKAMFDQSTMKLYNYCNSLWLVVYFFVLRVCQGFGTQGIFVGYTIFLTVRTMIASMLAFRINSRFSPLVLFADMIPSPIEIGMFGLVIFLTDVARRMTMSEAYYSRASFLSIVVGLLVVHAYVFMRLRSDYITRIKMLIFN